MIGGFMEKLNLPESLYGREQDIAGLHRAFEGACAGTRQVLFYAGIAGVGKTALVSEIKPAVVQAGGFFIQGKYNPQDFHVPYSQITSALNQLVGQVLTQGELVRMAWKERVLEALGENGNAVIELAPALEKLIGRQPRLVPVSPVESQNRFRVSVQRFLKVFSDSKYPLVFFLDDLQWADQASCELISVFLSEPDLRHILFIGAYRSNEVGQDHFLSGMFKDFEQENISWTKRLLEPLKPESISQMITNVLKMGANESEELSALVFQKTGGNPFFIREFLKSLYRLGLIRYNDKAGPGNEAGWHSDIEKIKKQKVSDDVVYFLTQYVEDLSPAAVLIMKVICCNRSQFDLELLSRVLNKASPQILEELKEALSEGMLVLAGSMVGFSHDKVREAVYSLLSEEEKEELHYKIGKELILSGKEEKNG